MRHSLLLTQFVLFLCPSLFVVPSFGADNNKNTLELIRKIPHSGYSEGLDYYEGYLWHALPKEIKKIDPKDGTVVATFPPATEYSESLTWFQGKLWNLSFHDNGLYSSKVDGKNLKFTREFTVPEVHGWGITFIGKELVFTGDYSNKLYFYDPKTKKITKTLETDGKDLEDLAWDGEYIWASSFTWEHGKIFAIHPKTGKILAKYSLPETEACNIIDSIAYDGKALWVTGKECGSIYYFKIPKLRAIASP